MFPTKFTRRMARPIRDFLAGLVLFTAVACSGVIDHRPAGSGPIAGTAHAQRFLEMDVQVGAGREPFAVPVGRIEQATGDTGFPALISLALAFSTVLAMNLWLARHVRRVHVRYSRRR